MDENYRTSVEILSRSPIPSNRVSGRFLESDFSKIISAFIVQEHKIHTAPADMIVGIQDAVAHFIARIAVMSMRNPGDVETVNLMGQSYTLSLERHWHNQIEAEAKKAEGERKQ